MGKWPLFLKKTDYYYCQRCGVGPIHELTLRISNPILEFELQLFLFLFEELESELELENSENSRFGVEFNSNSVYNNMKIILTWV